MAFFKKMVDKFEDVMGNDDKKKEQGHAGNRSPISYSTRPRIQTTHVLTSVNPCPPQKPGKDMDKINIPTADSRSPMANPSRHPRSYNSRVRRRPPLYQPIRLVLRYRRDGCLIGTRIVSAITTSNKLQDARSGTLPSSLAV